MFAFISQFRRLVVTPAGTVSWRVIAIVTGLVALPWLLLVVNRISPLTLGAEAIGYRFFHPWRIQNGDPGLPFLPQGQTLGLLHHVFVAVARLEAGGESRLRLHLDGFAFATNLSLTLALLGGLLLVRRQPIGFMLMAAILLFATYACRSGVYCLVDPDYYGFELASSLFVLGLVVRWHASPPRNLWASVALLGAMAGLMAGIKFTLAPTSLLALAVLLTGQPQPLRRRVEATALFGLVAALIFFAVLFLYYGGHASRLSGHFAMLDQFIKQGVGEERLWRSILAPSSAGADPGADYGYARIVFVVWLAAVSGGLVVCWRPFRPQLAVVLATTLLLACWHGWGLATRAAGTTLWEGCHCLLVGAAAVILILPTAPVRRAAGMTLGALLVAVAFVAGPPRLQQLLPVAALRAASDSIWGAHAEFRAAPGRRVFLIPDNNYTAGTVEETLMKGFSDHPTWAITTGEAMLRQFAGNLVVGHDPGAVPADATVFVVEFPHQPLASLSGRPVTRYPVAVFPWWIRAISLYRPVDTRTMPANP